jgi:Rhs element Vgr protein
MSVPVLTITADGVTLGPELEVFSLEVRKELDRVPEARLTVLDGSVAARKFALSDEPTFGPGAEVLIEIRDEGESTANHPLFFGLVTRQTASSSGEGTELRIDLRDAAFKLTRRRRSVVHRDQHDDEIARTIVEAAGLTAGTFDATAVLHPALVQYNATDWDFLLARADANGQVVIVDDGEVSLRSLANPGEVVASFAHGLDPIHEVELELDAEGQWARAEGTAWDLAEQAQAAPAAATDLAVTAGDLDIEAVATRLGGDLLTLVSPGSLAAEELAPWASARLARSRLALLRGRLVVDGRADIAPFDRVALEGVGKRFDGDLLVSGVTHRYDREGWRTELQIGLSPEWFARAPDLADVPASGLVPPLAGLHIGVILDFKGDPLGEHRVLVKLPALNDPDGSVWARMARPDAGKGRGFVFWPEIGDEVVVGFLGDDPRHAIVLGGLHGARNGPPPPLDAPVDDNPLRVIVSKSGTTIAFDDARKSLTITTPAGNTIAVDDEAGGISVADQHGNAITLDAAGITLKSAADFTIDAAGAVVIKGPSVDIQ